MPLSLYDGSSTDPQTAVRRMEQYLVQVETTKKALAAKNAEIAHLEQNKLHRLERPTADNPAVVQLQQDIATRMRELQDVTANAGQKRLECERAQLHKEEVQREMDMQLGADVDGEAHDRIDTARRNNRELTAKLRERQKDLFVKDQEVRRTAGRLREVEARGARLKQVEADSIRTLKMMGYSVRDLDQIKRVVEDKEKDLATIEEISDMMDDAINLMDSAVETARLEEEVASSRPPAEVAGVKESRPFESSPQLRLWRASGMAACAVYKAMILGRHRGKAYVGDEQFRQSHQDIADRLREAGVVREKLQSRVAELTENEEELRRRLQELVTTRSTRVHEETRVREQFEGPTRSREVEVQGQLEAVKQQVLSEGERLKQLGAEWERVGARARQT
jgi:hypothetical protein